MNIILCGFMGSGKTTIGHELARMTGRKFVDTDNMVENEQGTQIKNIFPNTAKIFSESLNIRLAKGSFYAKLRSVNRRRSNDISKKC